MAEDRREAWIIITIEYQAAASCGAAAAAVCSSILLFLGIDQIPHSLSLFSKLTEEACIAFLERPTLGVVYATSNGIDSCFSCLLKSEQTVESLRSLALRLVAFFFITYIWHKVIVSTIYCALSLSLSLSRVFMFSIM